MQKTDLLPLCHIGSRQKIRSFFSDYLCIFPNNFPHLLKTLFHLVDQTELRSCSYQIVFRIIGFKIGISLEIICQKTDATFQGHQPCPPRKTFDLLFCQDVFCLLQISLHIQLVQRKIKMYQIQILLILRRCRRTKADRIAEIIRRQSRHNRIQIDNAQTLSTFRIKKDII